MRFDVLNFDAGLGDIGPVVVPAPAPATGMDPSIVAAIISGSATVATTTISAVAASNLAKLERAEAARQAKAAAKRARSTPPAPVAAAPSTSVPGWAVGLGVFLLAAGAGAVLVTRRQETPQQQNARTQYWRVA